MYFSGYKLQLEGDICTKSTVLIFKQNKRSMYVPIEKYMNLNTYTERDCADIQLHWSK